jgi:nicotinamidase-related amidase
MTAPRRALIVVDIQQEYFDGPLQIQYPPREHSLANIVTAVEAATAQRVPVVVVQHQMPAGAPVFVEGTDGWDLHPEIEKRIDASTKRVHKIHGSVFAGTDVAEWLRQNDIDTITIVGHMANNCDLATAVEAEGLGFTAEILSDATGAINLSNDRGSVSARDLHETLMVLLHSNFAAVTTTRGWIEALDSGEPLEKSNLVVSAMSGREAAASV